jgi:surface antigen
MRAALSLFAAALIALGGLAGAPAPAGAEPPSWAPAHGWRAKHGQGHTPARYDDRDRRRYEERRPLFTETGQWLRCNRELAGQVLGGAVGAVIGSGIGDGDERLIAAGTGALIGVLLGGEIGRQLDQADRACFGQTLESVPTGRTVAWRNPDSGALMRTTPVDSYRNAAGRQCREYQATATVQGRERQVYGTACRQDDGTWEIQG